MDPLRVAVVGCGYWAPNIVRNLANIPSAGRTVSDGNGSKFVKRGPDVSATSAESLGKATSADALNTSEAET